MSSITLDHLDGQDNPVDLFKLFQFGIDAVTPEKLIHEHLRFTEGTLSIDDCTIDLNRYDNCYLCGSGKAAASMAKAMDTVMGNYIGGGIVVSPEEPVHLKHATCIQSTHPYPSQESIHAAEAMTNLFEEASERELIIYLLSGGTSALIEKPLHPLTLEDMVTTTKVLLENGCSIQETNSVRKHLSAIKGGKLAGMTKADVVVLVISDVIGDDLQTIGSAPLHSDQSTYEGIVQMLIEKDLMSRLPVSVERLLYEGKAGKYPETPKQPYPNVRHYLLASNQAALQGIAAKIPEDVKIALQKAPIQGNVEDAVDKFVDAFKVLPKNALLLCGGETTVNVRGSGKGGRNQHFALLCLARLKDRYNYEIICAGTDGIDGNSDAAGAYISNRLYERAADIEHYIETYDSNTFFEKYDSSIKTGYTGTNVMDLIIAYKGE